MKFKMIINFDNRIWMYLIILLIIYNSDTMWKRILKSPIYNQGAGIIIGFLCLISILQGQKIYISSQMVIKIIVLTVIMLAYAFGNEGNTEYFIRSVLSVFIIYYLYAYSLYMGNRLQVFFECFVNVTVIIALISLFFWFFGSIMNILPDRIPLTYEWDNNTFTSYTYHYLYFENPIQNMYHDIKCNLGVFVESPGYSSLLTYSLLIEIVNQIKRSENSVTTIISRYRLRILVIIITMITTNSSKGIIAVIIAYFIRYIIRKSNNNKVLVFRVLVIMVLAVVVTIAIQSIITAKLSSTSGLARLDDLLAGIKAFKEHPIFGVGYGNMDKIQRYRIYTGKTRGMSMGITTLMGLGGLWLLSIYIGAAIYSYGNRYFRMNKGEWILITTVLAYNLFISNTFFSDCYLFIIATAYAIPRKIAYEKIKC